MITVARLFRVCPLARCVQIRGGFCRVERWNRACGFERKGFDGGKFRMVCCSSHMHTCHLLFLMPLVLLRCECNELYGWFVSAHHFGASCQICPGTFLTKLSILCSFVLLLQMSICWNRNFAECFARELSTFFLALPCCLIFSQIYFLI